MYNRWYDKKENLKTIIDSIQSLEPSSKYAFALDVIQSVISKQPDKDAFLEQLSTMMPQDGTRWYDDDQICQSAVEMLKFIPEEEIEDLFKDNILSMIYENENFSRE